jgi:hypothetical protein
LIKLLSTFIKKNDNYKYIKTKYIDKFKEYYNKQSLNKEVMYLDFMSNYFHKGNPNSCIIFDLIKSELIYRINKYYHFEIDIKYNIVRELKLQHR